VDAWNARYLKIGSGARKGKPGESGKVRAVEAWYERDKRQKSCTCCNLVRIFQSPLQLLIFLLSPAPPFSPPFPYTRFAGETALLLI
jgi:hypothetical protein